MRAPDELRALVESYLGDLALTPELHGQAESVRYALAAPGKRVRPVICLATAEAAGAEPEAALPAAAALELVHNFMLVPDDGRRARARAGDARDDRRPVPRRHRRGGG